MAMLTIEELRAVVDPQFKSLNDRLDRMEKTVTSHDRWLWLLRGFLVALCGFLGIKFYV